MAFSATSSTQEPRSFSIGPLKMQIMTYTAASADVSGTVTATALKEVFHVIVDGLKQTSAASISGNVATLAFADPGVAGAVGTVICIGR